MNDSHETSNKTGADKKPGWERQVIEKLATASLSEQKKARRWGIFFKFLGFTYLTVVLVMGYRNANRFSEGVAEEHTAVVKFEGAIAANEVNADFLNKALRNAFEAEHSKAVILLINSPGGSPVQASRVYDEVKRLRAEYTDKPIYTVVEDLAASGGYFVAASTDKIYANRASLVGSIGVLMDGFGFVDTMEKLGVERRLLTAGASKGFLDPFSVQKPSDLAAAKIMLGDIHSQFIKAVKDGRGDRLSDDPEIFSGLIWTGQQAMENGLVDEFGDVDYVAREVVKAEKIVDYTPQESVLDSFAKTIGASMGKQMESSLGLNGLGFSSIQ